MSCSQPSRVDRRPADFHVDFLSVAPRLGGTCQPSQGLRSRDGANPEKKVVTDFNGGIHIMILGEQIREVKEAASAGIKVAS